MESQHAIVAILVAILFLYPSVHNSEALVFLHTNHVLQLIMVMHVSRKVLNYMTYDNNDVPIYSSLNGKSYPSCQAACEANTNPTGYDGGDAPPGGCSGSDFPITANVNGSPRNCCCASF